MSSASQIYEQGSASGSTCNYRWYAIHTRARHEKVVEQRLRGQGVSTFLPIMREVHSWSDRRKVVELPLFSSYLFVQSTLTAEERAQVFRVDGILGFVGTRGEASPIPDAEIESVRTLLAKNISWISYPFLTAGQRVRIRGGALDGVEGIFQSRDGDRKLVITVEAIQRSLAVSIEGYGVEPV
jgi:transcription antitermination factor NusG